MLKHFNTPHCRCRHLWIPQMEAVVQFSPHLWAGRKWWVWQILVSLPSLGAGHWVGQGAWHWQKWARAAPPIPAGSEGKELDGSGTMRLNGALYKTACCWEKGSNLTEIFPIVQTPCVFRGQCPSSGCDHSLWPVFVWWRPWPLPRPPVRGWTSLHWAARGQQTESPLWRPSQRRCHSLREGRRQAGGSQEKGGAERGG